MRKYISFRSILIVIIILLLIIEHFPYGIKNYKTKSGNIKIPRMAFKVRDENNFLVFESFRSSKDLKKEIDKILSDYQLIKEDDENYYYDIKQNITITKYELKPGFITSKIYIKFK